MDTHHERQNVHKNAWIHAWIRLALLATSCRAQARSFVPACCDELDGEIPFGAEKGIAENISSCRGDGMSRYGMTPPHRATSASTRASKLADDDDAPPERRTAGSLRLSATAACRRFAALSRAR